MNIQNEILNVLKSLKMNDSKFPKIRVGSNGDGGYVLPNDFEKIEKLLSIGIGEEDSFDRYFAERGVKVYQYDHTIDNPPSHHSNYQFHKIAWAENDDVDQRSLETMVDLAGINKTTNALLKFDTEGAEWDCFQKIDVEILKHFKIIVCELHGLNSIGNSNHRVKVKNLLDKLTLNHTPVHIHANNCCGITIVEGVPIPAVVEVTLLRNDRSKFIQSNSRIPSSLDYPSMTDRPEIILSVF